MITAGRLRRCRGASEVLELFRELGYPVHPVDVDNAEWKRGGVHIPWNGSTTFRLMARMPGLDLFVLDGAVPSQAVSAFLHDYASYNVLVKSVIINTNQNNWSLFDLSPSRKLRRLTVDAGGPSALTVDRLNLLDLAGADPRTATRIFDRALDRESVGRQFFSRFRAAVRDVAAELRAEHPDEITAQTDRQALLLLSRLLFLSFIQQKGWLNGERRFLVDRFDAARSGGGGIDATVLGPLFFGCLNTPRSQREESARRLGSIPYLNGGLFEPSPFEQRHPRSGLSDDLLRSVLESVFEKFDFSVDESDCAGTHIDPEMLGRVFESLMAEDERAASGSFYTPREIVDVLTSRAIVEWVSRSHSSLADGLQALLEQGAMSDELRTAGPALCRRLETISVLDPACGSGAFLLSALQVIERLTAALAPDRNVEAQAVRSRIVERSLYGLDVKPEAVRLCELRLWLAIVSRSDGPIEAIPPLPNLDRNILQGNALLGPIDFLGGHRAGVYRQWAHGLRAQRDLIERYRHATREERPALSRLLRSNDRGLAVDLINRAIEADEQELAAVSAPCQDLFGRPGRVDRQRCLELQERIASTRVVLERVEQDALDFFSFDVHFAHVMAAGGFDIVAGNPPWVRHARIDPQSRRMIRDRYKLFGRGRSTGTIPQPDLSLAFFERAVGLADPDGVVALLMPEKIANASYAAPLRRFVQENLSLRHLIDWSGQSRRLFKADTFPLGVIVRRGLSGPVRISSAGVTYQASQHDLALTGNEWALVPIEVAAILRGVIAGHAPLQDALARRPIMGVKTGDNQRFFVEGRLHDGHLITADDLRIPLYALCRCVRGRDLRRWTTLQSHWMLWPPAARHKEAPDWLKDLRLAFVRPEHVGVKVAWKDVSRGMAAAVLPDAVQVEGHAVPLVPNQTLYSIDCASLDEAYVIAAILNSTVAEAFLLATAERAKDDHYRYFGRTVGRLPMPRIPSGSAVWNRLVRLSRAAHRSGRAPEELDQVVAGLYGLEDDRPLREFVERRIGAR